MAKKRQSKKSIFNPDDSSRGYDDGYTAGLHGEDMDFVRSGMSWKFALRGSLAIDSYNKAYKEGYRKGCYDRRNKYEQQKVEVETRIQTNNTLNDNQSIMEEEQVIAKQIEQLEHFYSFLEDFKEELFNERRRFRNEVRLSHDAGLPREVASYISTNLGGTISIAMQKIISDIDDKHMPYIERAITLLKAILEEDDEGYFYDDEDYGD